MASAYYDTRLTWEVKTYYVTGLVLRYTNSLNRQVYAARGLQIEACSPEEAEAIATMMDMVYPTALFVEPDKGNDNEF